MPVPLENAVALGRIGGPLLAENLVRKNTGLGEENLAFHNTSDTDNILYLDVINGRIGVNTDNPQNPLEVNGTIHSNNYLAVTSATIAKYSISTNRIVNPFAGTNGKIILSPNQTLDPTIQGPRFETVDLGIDDALIENLTLDSNINLNTIGTGQVKFTTSELLINGDLTVTGKATWDGSFITLGSSSDDNIIFNADINSHIIPEVTDTWDLGSALQRWNTLYVKDLIADTLYVGESYIANNIDVLLRHENTIYVSVNGDDTNVGDHTHGTFRTIKHALSQATARDTVVIFPGTYEEIFPLTVPVGVTVNGAGIRAVTVKPTVGTNTNNAFLLNGETTVSNLTVKDFYAPGNAFSFASSFTVSTRSPYIQNVSVITAGPDAGNGALVDGSLANNASKEASMLFHSVTMIVPDAIGIKATNGARVEWLDCFTYFASIGIYLTQGTLGFASLGLKFGAELRSIGSANVYGTHGAIADGANTLGYLISHNFGYVGSGLSVVNDPREAIQANEIEELNSGKIYFESIDHKGDFRIGDIFLVNQETGDIIFNAQSITFTADGNITLEGPTSTAIIDKLKVQVGNIRIHDNNIDSLIGPVNFLAQSGNTYLSTNVTVTGNTNISADVKVKGNLTLGNESTDTINVLPLLTQHLVPDDVGGPYNLGSSSKRWNTLFTELLDVDGITQLTNNTISTLVLGTDLKFEAAGTGIIKITTSDVDITNNLEVNGLVSNSNFVDVDITGLLDITGNWNQTGNVLRTGNTDVSGWLKVNGAHIVQFEDVQISGNTITTTVGNNNLEFIANGTGIVKTNLSDVEITNNLDVTGDGFFNSLEVRDALEVTDINIDDVYIVNNTITTTGTDQDLILSADNTGIVNVTTTDVTVSNDLTVGNNLTVNGDTSLKDTVIRTEISTPTTTQTAQNVSGTSTPTGFFFYGWADDLGQINPPFGVIQVGWSCVEIPGSVVTAVGDGVTNYDITITGGSFASGGFYSFTGNVVTYGPQTLTQTGNINQTGSTDVTGDFQAGNIVVLPTSWAESGQIKLQGSTISVKPTDTDLILLANGIGGVIFDRQIKIRSNKISNIFDINDLSLSFNNILTTEDGEILLLEDESDFLLADTKVDGDLSITFSPNGTGNVIIAATTALAIAYGTAVLELNGEIRQNTDGVYEGFSNTSNVSFTSIYDADHNTYITAEATPGANDNTIRLYINGSLQSYIDTNKVYNNKLHVDSVEVTNNQITNLNNSNDLKFVTTGTGVTSINSLEFSNNAITNSTNDVLILQSTGTGYIKFTGSNGIVLPVGDDTERRGLPEVGETRYNDVRGYVEIYQGTEWVPVNGGSNAATEEEIVAETNLWAFILG